MTDDGFDDRRVKQDLDRLASARGSRGSQAVMEQGDLVSDDIVVAIIAATVGCFSWLK